MKCNLDFISGLTHPHVWGWVQIHEKQIFCFPLFWLSILPKVFEYDLFNVWKGGSELKGWIWKDGFPISECTSAKPQTDFPLKLPNAFLHLLKYVTLWVRLKDTCFCWCLWSCICLSSNSWILRTTKKHEYQRLWGVIITPNIITSTYIQQMYLILFSSELGRTITNQTIKTLQASKLR